MNAAGPAEEHALVLQGISVHFDGLVALHEVSFEVPDGRICGLIGPNGAGKSTLFNVISGLVPATSGRIVLNGHDVTARPAHSRAKLGVQRTFQSLQIIRSMTVLENILAGLYAKPPDRREPVAKRWSNASAVEYAANMAEAIGIGKHLYSTTEGLSFRDQRYVEIARALVSSPRLLMLDEPAAGLSAVEIDQFREMLVRMQKAMGFAVLLVEHLISLVVQLCEQVVVLESGTLIANGPAAAVTSDKEVIRAYLGEGLDA